jgi:hypothetical protein
VTDALRDRVGHTPESITEAISPVLDAFVVAAEPKLKKAAEDFYEHFLSSVEMYLRDNAQWNISEDIRRCRKIELESLKLREQNRELLEALQPIDQLFRDFTGPVNEAWFDRFAKAHGPMALPAPLSPKPQVPHEAPHQRQGCGRLG